MRRRQRAAAFVDGKCASTWFDQGVSNGVGYDGHERCGRDEDFPLSAALTAGKASVTITMRYSGSGSFWTASRYRMFSFTV